MSEINLFKLFSSNYTLILLFSLSLSMPQAKAEDCFLDTNNNGSGDSTANASSGGIDTRIACGRDATAGGAATAVGYKSNASADFSVAIGGIDTSGGVQGATAIGGGNVSIGAKAISYGFLNFESGNTAIGAQSVAGSFITQSVSDATAIGYKAQATGTGSVALGVSSSISAVDGIAIGRSAEASGSFHPIAIGYNSSVVANDSIAVGAFAEANAENSTVFGRSAFSSGVNSIAIGYNAAVTHPGAIALGANVTATKANTMTVGVPIEIVRDDGSSNLLVEEKNAMVAVRTLGELSNNGGVRLRFNNTALGEEWDFTSNQTGGFQFSLVGSGGAELSVGTNGTVRMGPGPISNLTLFPSGNMTIEGVLTENSDINSKQEIKVLDSQSILEKVANLPIHKWEYKNSPDQRHIGPMAQDFHESFNLGGDNKHIATLDMAGVALASIQALKTENEELNHEILKLKKIVQRMSNRIDMFE